MKNLTWPQARRLARAGRPVRRIAGGYWFTFETALWILNDAPRRVALAADFGAAEFTAADWTDEQGDNGLPLWPNIGGPIAQIVPGSDSPATGDPVVTIALRSSLSPTGEGCLVTVPATCTIYADVTVAGGPSGVGSADVIVEGVTQTVDAYPGYSATLTFEGVSIAALDELDGSIEYTDSAAFAWPVEVATYTVPAQCPPAGWESHRTASVNNPFPAPEGGSLLSFPNLPIWSDAAYTATLQLDWVTTGQIVRIVLKATQGTSTFLDDVTLYDSDSPGPAGYEVHESAIVIPDDAGGLYLRVFNAAGPWTYDLDAVLTLTPV